MAKPKILIIENSIDVTGALKSITRTAYDLKDYFDFHFIIPSNSKGRFWIEGKGFSAIEELPMRELSKRISSLLVYVPFIIYNTFRLQRIVKSQNIKIIHVNDLYNLLPVMMKVAGSKVPYICHIRFLPNHFPAWLFNFWLKLQLRYAKKVVAVSQSVLNMLPIHPKLVLIHNELPAEERYPQLSRPMDQSHRTFLYLSNFMTGKGQNYALDAFEKIHDRLPQWRLRFVGGDMGLNKNKMYRNKLQLQAKALGIDKKTEWHEFAKEVESEYKLADIILNFSESESFSLTCLEALYFGRPLIATDCGGPAEIIDDQVSGLLVKNKDVNAMANAMLLLALEEEMSNKFSIEGIKRSREKFSIEKTSNRLRDVYHSIICNQEILV